MASVIEARYTIYLHKKTLARSQAKREKADSDIRLAIGMVKDNIREYGEESGSYIWRVLIVQAPHVSTAPQNVQPRGRHYTVYGLSPVNKVDSEVYRKCWVLHVNVSEDDVVTNTDFQKSYRNGRRCDYADSHMRLLSGPFSI
ncbi:hypothetical protein HYPSUDRAFT_200953 [Hypholoma sublateritium FD-334 SS-4]|uniref:Uncharacterized protein n=1 Tax=Hypholoma sublateritium (strain FD-334 SS-4) TaxID=945553 RepID=A0A0D2P593_HYPSF|nr:hypothetical protein HYPSUDRAFT_200953 [Hypholoma sublateritium FD-334 SS-4]